MCDSCQKHKEEAAAKETPDSTHGWIQGKIPMPPPYEPPAPWTVPPEVEVTSELLVSETVAKPMVTHYEGDGCAAAHGKSPPEATKYDQGKTDLSLLPYRPLLEIAEVLEFGAQKYSRDNWRKGFAWTRLIAAMMRHLGAFNNGEDLDPESDLSHLAHLGCMLLFLMEHTHTHKELDDRWVPLVNNEVGR